MVTEQKPHQCPYLRQGREGLASRPTRQQGQSLPGGRKAMTYLRRRGQMGDRVAVALEMAELGRLGPEDSDYCAAGLRIAPPTGWQRPIV